MLPLLVLVALLAASQGHAIEEHVVKESVVPVNAGGLTHRTLDDGGELDGDRTQWQVESHARLARLAAGQPQEVQGNPGREGQTDKDGSVGTPAQAGARGPPGSHEAAGVPSRTGTRANPDEVEPERPAEGRTVNRGQGPPGPPGPPGQPAPPGPPGIPAPPGSPGPPGQPGIQGPQGLRGVNLSQGPPGPAGPNGDQGQKGAMGKV